MELRAHAFRRRALSCLCRKPLDGQGVARRRVGNFRPAVFAHRRRLGERTRRVLVCDAVPGLRASRPACGVYPHVPAFLRARNVRKSAHLGKERVSVRGVYRFVDDFAPGLLRLGRGVTDRQLDRRARRLHPGIWLDLAFPPRAPPQPGPRPLGTLRRPGLAGRHLPNDLGVVSRSEKSHSCLFERAGRRKRDYVDPSLPRAFHFHLHPGGALIHVSSSLVDRHRADRRHFRGHIARARLALADHFSFPAICRGVSSHPATLDSWRGDRQSDRGLDERGHPGHDALEHEREGRRRKRAPAGTTLPPDCRRFRRFDRRHRRPVCGLHDGGRRSDGLRGRNALDRHGIASPRRHRPAHARVNRFDDGSFRVRGHSRRGRKFGSAGGFACHRQPRAGFGWLLSDDRLQHAGNGNAMNSPTIWIIAPAVIAVLLILVRNQRALSLIGGTAAVLLAASAQFIPTEEALKVGALSFRIESSLSVLGRELLIKPEEGPLLALIFGGTALWFFGAEASKSALRFAPLGLLITALMVASIAVEPFLFAALFIEMAVLLAVPLLAGADQPPGRGVVRFLIYQTLAMPFILISGWLLAGVEVSPGNLALAGQAAAVLGLGFAFLLAIFPLYNWIPMLLEETHPFVVGFLLWIIPTITLIFGAGFIDRYSWLRTSPELTTALQFSGLLMLVTGGLWAAFQNHLGRIMAFGSIADTGFCLLALSLDLRLGIP
ncbi:hypothetical protein FBQ81_00830, partial [Chloroflexi bacterium CFX6]|nr:hypothetical protein [Chloroflexi bacterium CFX6]